SYTLLALFRGVTQELSINRPLLPARLVQALRAARNTGQLRRRGTSDVDFPTPLQRSDERRAMPWKRLLRAIHRALLLTTDGQLAGLRLRASSP
ncbi:MAG TPA: hypothetical protein VF395_05585, partial [Polyangiaceae bacterium]